jgi:hypothetical protein
MAQQVNVFVENKPGRIRTVTQLLADNAINIRAIVIQDRADFGVMKILVNDPHRALRVLAGQGLAAALKTVLAIQIDDKPGGLNKLLQVLFDNQINIIDAYGFVVESGSQAMWCVEVDNYDHARAVVEKQGFRIPDEAELYEL